MVNVATLIKAGRYREALSASASALEECDQYNIGGHSTTLRAMRALILYEPDERAEARLEVEAALPLLPSQGVVDALIPGYIVAARLSQPPALQAKAVEDFWPRFACRSDMAMLKLDFDVRSSAANSAMRMTAMGRERRLARRIGGPRSRHPSAPR